MTVQDYLQTLLKYLGQPVESEDPTALDQCMDWAFKGCDILGIDRSAIRHEYAYQAWYSPTDTTVTAYEMIPNTPLGTVKAGDTVIFDQNVAGVTGVAGHICICVEDGDTNSFKSLDQNWNGVQHITEETHTYDGVVGWLRPRTFQQQVLDQLRTDRDTNYNNWQQDEQKITDLQTQLAACQSEKVTPTEVPVTTNEGSTIVNVSTTTPESATSSAEPTNPTPSVQTTQETKPVSKPWRLSDLIVWIRLNIKNTLAKYWKGW